jgi:uroporphyrinogen-III synthase
MILVTRPEEASRRTAERLAQRGREILCDPLLALDFMPPQNLIGDARPDAVVITSANGARAVAGHADLARLTALPLWTVGSRTTEAARALGFGTPRGEAQDVNALAAMLNKEPPQVLLYPAGEIRSGDLTELAPRHTVETRVVYKATPASALSPATVEALRAGKVSEVLHYSRRLAETYLALADAAGITEAALKPRQLCLSDQVAAPLRGAGAKDIAVATEPREDALLALCDA